MSKQTVLPLMNQVRETMKFSTGVLGYYCAKFCIYTEWDGEYKYLFRVKDAIANRYVEDIEFEGTLIQAEDKYEEIKTRYVFDREGKLSC